MKEITINSFTELDRSIDGLSRSSLFRGVSNVKHELIPSLFRRKDLKSINITEENMMWVFRTSAKPLINRLPDSKLEWLVIAQHHGLPTRLLDWSLSPLVACFFAIESLSKEDGAIYILDRRKFKKEEDINLEDLKNVVAFIPSHSSKRVTAQSGIFTIHPNDEIVLEGDDLIKLIIPSAKKGKILEKLIKYGIHHGTVFPDLDGLSNYIKYLNSYKGT